MPSISDEYSYGFEVDQNGVDIKVIRSKGRKLDKISGQFVVVENDIDFIDCALCTEKRTRERIEVDGKSSEEFLQIIYDGPLYAASENDNSSEDRIEYPVGCGVIYRVTEVSRQGHALCLARAVKMDAQKECSATKSSEIETGANLIGFGGD